MLTLDDFELVAIPETVLCVPGDCHLARDADMQRDLAIMCIEKATLCICQFSLEGEQVRRTNGFQNVQRGVETGTMTMISNDYCHQSRRLD